MTLQDLVIDDGISLDDAASDTDFIVSAQQMTGRLIMIPIKCSIDKSSALVTAISKHLIDIPKKLTSW